MAYPRPPHKPIADFFTFRLMITPLLIETVFWIGSLLCIIAGGKIMFDSQTAATPARQFAPGDDVIVAEATKGGFKKVEFVTGVLLMFLGPLVVRIVCELDIVLFKIHDELKSANERAQYRST